MDESRGPSIGAMAKELLPFVGDAMDYDHPVVVSARNAWAHAMTGAELDRTESRQLLVYLSIEILRDRMIADVLDVNARTTEDFDAVFLGKYGSPPDNARLNQAGTVIASLARYYEEDLDDVADTAPSLAVLAWLVWMKGGHLSDVQSALAMANTVDPTYDLATLLFGLIFIRGTKPRWMVG